MSELWICREQTAVRAFVPEIGEPEIRNIEELCYYLYENIEHLDESVMSERLYVWLSEEMALPRLAATLRQEQVLGKDCAWCAWLLLKEIGIYTEEELEEIRTYCLTIESKDEFERWKIRADRLLQNRKYGSAIKEYKRMLQNGMADKKYPQLMGDIWHNIGVANAGLFLFPEAAECFRQAYELNKRYESFKASQDALTMATEDRLVEWDESISENLDWAEELSRLRDDYRKKVI